MSPSLRDRWATFDCYGTLIDWNQGIRGELERLFGVERAPELLERYHELEPQVQTEDPSRSYREVLTLTLERLATDARLSIPEGETNALAASLPTWEPFPEVREALEEARSRGWKLAILSNSDTALIASSQAQIGVPFQETVVAEEIDSYKPAHAHWEEFFRRSGADRGRHVHVAASLFHDIAPTRELGLTSVWVNRLDEQADPEPTRELTDLRGLPDVLDELVASG